MTEEIIIEASISDLQAAMATGQFTTRGLVEIYLQRIEALDRSGPQLCSIIEVNPDALALADALDAERRARGPRGPLHGIPILLKDNIDTADRMQTTAGSLALVGDPPRQDATVARRLREAGALLLGKANLSEWANIRGHKSRNGWSARGGQTRNPYVLDQDPSGSSAGSAVAAAAGLCAASLGTETDGSIVGPAAANCVVGIKPAVGLTSRAGVIPIAHSQDTVGPMARTVADAAMLLGAIAGPDDRDPGSRTGEGGPVTDYTRFLDPEGLKGARIGLPFGRGNGVTEAAIQRIQEAGAVIVEPTPIPAPDGIDLDDLENAVLQYELKADLNAYLATRVGVPVRTLGEVIAFNQAHADQELALFGQETFEAANARGPLTDPEYLDAREKCWAFSGPQGIDAVMEQYHLDALFAPNCDGRTTAARAGYPLISVPAGFDREMPVSVVFIGRAFSEPILIRLAYAFEQLTQARRPPRFLASRPEA